MDNKKLGFALIGCGRFGSRRMKVLKSLNVDAQILCVADIAKERAETLANELGCDYYTNDESVVNREDVDCVVVSVPNKYHMEVSIQALEHGKHVLCEKPLARTPKEAKAMVDAASKNHVFLKTGSNLRYFPNIQKARELIDDGAIGEVMYTRGWVGHKRIHEMNPWFLDKEITGGGALIDTGCHILDLTEWFLGKIKECTGYSQRLQLSVEAEDNGFGLLKTFDGKIGLIQSSWTEWEGYMYMEVHGKEGYIIIDNRGRKSKTIYCDSKREIQEFDYSQLPPQSYELELKDYIVAIKENRQPLASGIEGMRVIQMIQAIYTSAKKGRTVNLDDVL